MLDDVWIQLSAAPAKPLSDGEAEAEAAAEDDVEAEGLQQNPLACWQRRQSAA